MAGLDTVASQAVPSPHHRPDRFPGHCAAPIVISNQRYAGFIGEQLGEIGVTPAAVILEPFARNTAAVAAVAARQVARTDPDGLVLLLPSDHFIGQPDIFIAAVTEAAATATSGFITTFGIRPDRPETGFGYIQRGETLSGPLSSVSEFKEKPDLETALKYVADPAFSWNAGIFLFPAGLMIDELEKLAPDILDAATAALDAAAATDGGLLLDPNCFEAVRSTSIDYAVMESTSRAAVYAPLACQWSDIGTWDMISTLSQRGNAIEPVLIDSGDCTVRSDADHLVALVGVDGLIVVVEGNRVLVSHKDRAQDVGKIVKALKDGNRNDLL